MKPSPPRPALCPEASASGADRTLPGEYARPAAVARLRGMFDGEIGKSYAFLAGDGAPCWRRCGLTRAEGKPCAPVKAAICGGALAAAACARTRRDQTTAGSEQCARTRLRSMAERRPWQMENIAPGAFARMRGAARQAEDDASRRRRLRPIAQNRRRPKRTSAQAPRISTRLSPPMRLRAARHAERT